jgi:hypothetical protein
MSDNQKEKKAAVFVGVPSGGKTVATPISQIEKPKTKSDKEK